MRAPSLVVVTVLLAAILNASPQTDFSAARAAAAGLSQLHSLLVSHRGELILEHYAPKNGPNRLANIKSASKSIISTLVGIAIERKLIPTVARRSFAGSRSCATIPTNASRRSPSRTS